MQGSTSKLRNVYGDHSIHKFDDITMSDHITDGSMIDANTHFVAFSYKTSVAGQVAVIDAKDFHRLPPNPPLLSGHTAPILDIKFSPFRTNLLATGSEDTSVRLWEIAQGGIANGYTEQQKYTGHSKKVTYLSFSPVVEELIATSSYDNTVQVWNILNGSTYCNVNLGDVIYSLDWNHDSSLLSASTKKKLIEVIDPRTGQVTMKTTTHEGNKPQKHKFLNDDFILSVGFSRSNERAIKLFDLRNISEPVQNLVIDNSSGVITPFYDSDLGLVYLVGKGEPVIKVYDFSNEKIKYATEYRSSQSLRSFAFFPKRAMNYNQLEIGRFARAYGTNLDYVSFYYPKKHEGYDESVYPECFAGEPALALEEWLKGENRKPIKKKITSLENSWSASAQTFEKKVEEVHHKPEDLDKAKVS
jgi:WD40 repeat protein